MMNLITNVFATVERGTVLCPVCKKGYQQTGNVEHGVFDCPNGCGCSRLRHSARNVRAFVKGRRYR